MGTQVGYGPLWRVDGPPPQPPAHTILDVARVLDDADSGGVERWINGIVVYPYPADHANVWDTCAFGTTATTKAAGTAVPLPEFGAFTVYMPETCSSFGIWASGMSNDEAQARFVARANMAFTAIEGPSVEKEFMAGAVMGLNPYLADGNGVINATSQSVLQGFAYLENQIAGSGRRGVIHCTPAVATLARSHRIITDDGKPTDVLYTVAGTPVVPGYGYVGSTHVAGQAALSGTQEYMFATGPIDIRRSEVITVPDQVSMALDRAKNTITYQAERYYAISWDTVVQVAVLVDKALG